MDPQLHSQDQDFKSSWWRCCFHQSQACVFPLVGDAHGPAKQARPWQSSGLPHLPPGPRLLSLTSPFLAPSSFLQPCLIYPPTPEHSTLVPAFAGQTPLSRAELLVMVFANSLELVRRMSFVSFLPSLSQTR